jgi:TRAP-type C4-dicarboxylate transport system substrate-binding protein
MLRLVRPLVAALAACAVLLPFGAVPASAQEKIELKLSHYVPSTHLLHTELLEPWAKSIEQRTGGRVVVRLFAGNSSLGNMANQLDQVKAGVVDIAMGLAALPRGRFPRTQIAELPFLFDTADTASRTLWALYPKYLKDDQGYQGLRVLMLHAHNGGLIHSREKKIAVADDLKGMRVRSPSAVINNMLATLGASPVGLPAPQVYENLQRGVIDAATFPWDPVNSFKLAEVTKFHLEARGFTSPFWLLMNERKYASLPADVRKAIDELSGPALVDKVGKVWDAADKLGKDSAIARGNTITVLSNEERQRWVAALAGMINREILALEGQGVPNAREIYLEMQRANERFSQRKG